MLSIFVLLGIFVIVFLQFLHEITNHMGRRFYLVKVIPFFSHRVQIQVCQHSPAIFCAFLVLFLHDYVSFNGKNRALLHFELAVLQNLTFYGSFRIMKLK